METHAAPQPLQPPPLPQPSQPPPQQQRVLEAILDTAILDVRRHEAMILAENADLSREVEELRAWKAEALQRAEAVEVRRVALFAKEDAARKRAAVAKRREAAVLARERRVEAMQPQRLRGAVEREFAQVLLEYMQRCEEMLGQPDAAAAARRRLEEVASLEAARRAVPQHLDALAQAHDEVVAGLQGEVRELTNKVESPREEGKACNGGAAARFRERKAQREKKELLQALVTAHNLCSKIRSQPDYRQVEDLEVLAQVVEGARQKFV